MESNFIVQQLRSFIIENFLFDQDGNVKDEDSFLQGGILDSTGVLELVAFLEEKYGITVEEGELTPENLDSINNISVYLSRKMGRGQEEEGESAMGAVNPGGNK